MARFEVHIPAAKADQIGVTLRVEADHWMAALKAGLHKLGEQGFSAQNVLVDVQDDGSVQVTESRNGRVLEIRELPPSGGAAKPSGEAPPLPLTRPAPARTEPPLPPARPAPAKAEPPLPPARPAPAKAEPPLPLTRPAPAKAEPPLPLTRPAPAKAEPPLPLTRPAPARTEPPLPPTRPAPARTEPPLPPTRPAPTKTEPPSANSVRPAAARDDHPTLLEHPTLLDLPAGAASPPMGESAILDSKDGARRDSKAWPWGASLSPLGQVEGVKGDGAQPPASRAPPPASRPPPAKVIDLPQPTRAVKAQIGRTLDGVKHRESVEDALADVFERVQGAYGQKGEQAALYLLLDLALEKIPAESGSVLLTNGSGDLAFAGARGPKAAQLLQSALVVPAGVGIAGFCAVEGVSVALSDVQRDPRWYAEVSERLQYETKSVLCAPMMTHGRSFGCIQLINRHGIDTFTEHEIGMLAYIAHQGALYLNSRT